MTDIFAQAFPQPVLAIIGLALLALVPPGAVWAWRDPRRVGGEAPALKPIRFAASIGLYMLTASAMFALIRPEDRSALLAIVTVWTMVAGCMVEFACITLQAVRGERSHFNISTRFDAAVFAVMGIFAILFVGALLPLAWLIAFRPNTAADPVLIRATVAGLLATVAIGGGTGHLMGTRGSHGTDRGGLRLPFMGWSLTGGDIRAPHFFGIHAMQALPLTALGSRWLAPERAGPLTIAGALIYGAVMAVTLYLAMRERSTASALT